MSKFIITGGQPLYGSVRLGGAKNASYKLLIASLLANQPGYSRILNFSRIEDVEITKEIINSLGGGCSEAGERTLLIQNENLHKFSISDEFGPKSRASTMFIPVLLHKFKKASVPLPGGDKIGNRSLDRHFDGLKAMGVNIEVKDGRIECMTEEGLKGTTYTFNKNSHTGTETLIMAAVLATGVTVLKNAALEPEVDDLIEFLKSMGAKIIRKPNKEIEIIGVDKLNPSIHKLMPDRNEAVSYACAALVTQGDIIVENARADHLGSFLDKLDEIGAGYEIGKYGIRFFYKGKLKATEMTTTSHPGFMTDWQPLWTVLMTQAEGESIIHETVFSNRFQHVDGLIKFGANIQTFNIKVENPEEVYNFEKEEINSAHPHAIKIFGKSNFKPCELDVYDLRSGATFTLAALATIGKTVLNKVELIDRGYESFDSRLRSMGASIIRIDE